MWRVLALQLLYLLSIPLQAEVGQSLLTGKLIIREARKIHVGQNGGQGIIHFSNSGHHVYRMGLSSVFRIPVDRSGYPEKVLDSGSIPGASWFEGLEKDDGKNGWFILLGHVNSKKEPVVYRVESDFSSPKPVLWLMDVVPNLPDQPVDVQIFKKNSHSEVYVLGYTAGDEKRLVFFRKDEEKYKLIRSDIFSQSIKSFAFNEEGSSGVAVAEGVVVFYVISEGKVIARRIFSVADTSRPQVTYRKTSREFVFVSKFDLHTLSVRDNQPVLVSDRILSPESNRAFWGPVAVADGPGIVALAEVFGAGFYDLNRGLATTFVQGDSDFEFLDGNFSAHSVAVSPDGRTFVFNGVDEVGVVHVEFSPDG